MGSSESIDAIPPIITDLYRLVQQLEMLYPGRKFTPDGHLIGSIGEVIAADTYGLELLPASSKRHDAKSPSGVLVQIKATQGSKVGLRDEPQHLIVLTISKDACVTEVFNGPGAIAWAVAGKLQRNGQRQIAVTKLKSLMNSVPPEARLEKLR